MKQPIKPFILSGIFFGLFMCIVFTLLYGYIFGIISGFFSGTFFALFLGLFTHFQSTKFKVFKQEISRDTRVLYDGAANHFKGKEAVGGWLFLTCEKIIFKSHNFNIQNHEIVVFYDDIIKITKRNTLGIVPNGIMIQINNGNSEKFVLNGRDIWIQKISQLMTANI